MINKSILSIVMIFSLVEAEGYWQQYVHYFMDVKLDPESHEVHGITKILYVNHSPNELDRIYMHLYPNAFQEGSVKHREYMHMLGRLGRMAAFLEDITPYLSRIDIHSFKTTNKNGVISSDYKVDDTILMATLPEVLSSGDTLTIEIDWTHHVGKQIERAGYVDEQYNMAQWYPKMVVYDEKGWHAIPFHAEGEFYGEFGTFDVTIDLPGNYIVGASGVVTAGDPGWNDVKVDTSRKFSEWIKEFKERKPNPDSTARRIVSFHADQVHDFAWITSPTFLYEHGSWKGIDVHVLFNESNGEKWSKVVRERSERALEWLSTKFGLYPYPQVTTTDRRKGGGMEYPMLVMNGSESEGLIVHEIGHVWFYGILGNNEVDEAWLDEGFTTFQTRWYLENRYPPLGRDFSLSAYKPFQKKLWRFTSRTDWDHWNCIKYITSKFDEPISRSSYLFDSGSAYRQNAYTKPSLMLNELRWLLGDSLFLAGMQTYFNRWKLKHVNEERFISTMEEISKQDLDWFFDAWLHDTQLFDAAIKSWGKKRLEDGRWEVSLEIHQLGNRFLPIEIETKLKNGEKHRTWWRNHLWRYEDTFNYTVPGKPVQIVLDPDGMTVDLDRRNNHAGRMKSEWMYRWPGMNYQPRDRYVLQWSPLLYYHDLDGYMPGIWLSREYGYFEGTSIKLNYALESNKIYWSINGRKKPVRKMPGIQLDFTAFDQGAQELVEAHFQGNWSKQRYIPPFHRWTVGLYRVNAKDTSRTDLYDPGVVTAFSGSYTISLKGNYITLGLDVAPGGWSDWRFNRLSSKLYLGLSKGSMGFRNRLLAGFMWSDTKGIPVQERFSIEGAGSGNRYSKPYLRDESSFYGFTELRNHYHLAGDANLRGYLGKGYAGVEKVVVNSLELFYKLPVSMLKLEVTGFVDSGLFWGSQFSRGDNGFDGNILADGGLGIRLEKSLLGKPFYLRIDSPFWLSEPGINGESLDFKRWVFGLERGI